MKINRMIFLLTCLLLVPVASAKGAWKIEFFSGGSVEANSCRTEKGRVYLEYPVGEVSFSLSKVKSVSQDESEVSIFQQKGTSQKNELSADGTESNQTDDTPFDQGHGNSEPAEKTSLQRCPAGQKQPDARPEITPVAGTSQRIKSLPPDTEFDPEAEEIISGLEAGEQARQAELEKKMDELFESKQPEETAPGKVQILKN